MYIYVGKFPLKKNMEIFLWLKLVHLCENFLKKTWNLFFVYLYWKISIKKNTNIVFVAYIHVHNCIFMSENFPLKTWKLFTCIFMLKAFQNIT